MKFPKIKGHLEILGARRVTGTKFHTENPQILGRRHTKSSRHDDLATGISASLLISTSLSSLYLGGSKCEVVSTMSSFGAGS
jgi:hypothetical protein